MPLIDPWVAFSTPYAPILVAPGGAVVYFVFWVPTNHLFTLAAQMPMLAPGSHLWGAAKKKKSLLSLLVLSDAHHALAPPTHHFSCSASTPL